eukprot:17734-Heterococcus_DN1.PRE.2
MQCIAEDRVLKAAEIMRCHSLQSSRAAVPAQHMLRSATVATRTCMCAVPKCRLNISFGLGDVHRESITTSTAALATCTSATAAVEEPSQARSADCVQQLLTTQL